MPVQAGQELSFLGASKNLQTSSSSFRYVPSNTIGVAKVVATRTGTLEASKPATAKKDQSLLVDVTPWHATRYLPKVDDTIIAIVTQKNPEFFTLDINGHSTAMLSSLEFLGATRRDKPKYEEGTLVFCKVILADRLAKTQLSCISALDKKSW